MPIEPVLALLLRLGFCREATDFAPPGTEACYPLLSRKLGSNGGLVKCIVGAVYTTAYQLHGHGDGSMSHVESVRTDDAGEVKRMVQRVLKA